MVTRMFSPQGLPLLSGGSLWLDSLLASDLRGVFLRRSWMEKPVGYWLRLPQLQPGLDEPHLKAVMGT